MAEAWDDYRTSDDLAYDERCRGWTEAREWQRERLREINYDLVVDEEVSSELDKD